MSTADHPAHSSHESAADTQDRPQPVSDTLTVLVYSDDPKTRESVRMAVGRRPASDLPRVDYVESSDADDVVATVDEGGIDLAVLDGEAVPTGGMGLCRQLKNELRICPPILLLTGRRDDRWLATWSQADGAVAHPLDAIELVDAVVPLLRRSTVDGRVVRSH